MDVLAQFGTGIENILYFVFIMIFMFFYPRLMIMQMLWRLDQTATELEEHTTEGKKIVLKRISKKANPKVTQAVNNFLEYFLITPVSLDPYGIVKKFEHLLNLQDKRFKYFVDSVAPELGTEAKNDVIMGLSAAISLNQIAKIVRHYVELIRKTKNLQLAMVLQMQVPMIEKIAKALLKGTEAFTNEWPVGDGAGCLAVAHMIGDSKAIEMVEETMVARRVIKGRTVYIVKAKGPGGRLGNLSKAAEKIVRQNKITKIITIDAAAKLEGEKTGSLAEGVGVAIGGIGVDRAYIEDIAVRKNLPLDTVVIKMSQEEAIQPMVKKIVDAVPGAIKIVEENIERTKGKVLLIGVGNTSGVGNNKKAAIEAEKQVAKVSKIIKARKEEEKKKSSWLFGE